MVDMCLTATLVGAMSAGKFTVAACFALKASTPAAAIKCSSRRYCAPYETSTSRERVLATKSVSRNMPNKLIPNAMGQSITVQRNRSYKINRRQHVSDAQPLRKRKGRPTNNTNALHSWQAPRCLTTTHERVPAPPRPEARTRSSSSNSRHAITSIRFSARDAAPPR